MLSDWSTASTEGNVVMVNNTNQVGAVGFVPNVLKRVSPYRYIAARNTVVLQ